MPWFFGDSGFQLKQEITGYRRLLSLFCFCFFLHDLKKKNTTDPDTLQSLSSSRGLCLLSSLVFSQKCINENVSRVLAAVFCIFIPVFDLQKWQIRCRAHMQLAPVLTRLTLCFLFTKLQTLVPRAYVRSSGSRVHKSSLLQLTGMWPFPSSTQDSRPGGTGRAVGALWDRHKLCEHSCRAILLCLLAA